LVEAVSLYHLVVEGILFSAGQHALLRLLDDAEPPLPGLRQGTERVLADERWHIGFGTCLLAEMGAGAVDGERLLAEARPAVAAWREAIRAEEAERVPAVHERRLRAASLMAPDSYVA
jgi:ribonucleoside-diphosphate reductase beta chain